MKNIQFKPGEDFTMISLPGMMKLVLMSKIYQADFFREWLVEDVLPVIKNSGQYVLDGAEDPEPITGTVDILGILVNPEKRIRKLPVGGNGCFLSDPTPPQIAIVGMIKRLKKNKFDEETPSNQNWLVRCLIPSLAKHGCYPPPGLKGNQQHK